MASPASSSPEKQPLRACPSCSTMLCIHLACRTCGSCPECDQSPATTAAQEKKRNRVADLQKLGISMDDMEDAIRVIDDLHSTVCRCQNRKRVDWSFCSDCYRELPGNLRDRLKLHITTGLLPAVREAWTVLAKRFERNA